MDMESFNLTIVGTPHLLLRLLTTHQQLQTLRAENWRLILTSTPHKELEDSESTRRLSETTMQAPGPTMEKSGVWAPWQPARLKGHIGWM